MITVNITASSTYQVTIGHGLLSRTGEYLSRDIPGLSQKTLVLVSDSNVIEHYGNTVIQSLKQVGCQVLTYKIPAGESSKNWALLGEFLEFLADLQITRSDMLIALGGGVVGDFTGFAASVYLRGIPFAQLPTTLLAAVDSSVGGKTAVDLHAGKNLAGTFWQPVSVICDTDSFSTLSHEAWLDGVAESIKYGILQDVDLFLSISNGALSTDCETIIAKCIEMKGKLVGEDEYDRGLRELLNLGHTFGHAIEALSRYTVSHGHAVAVGMHLAGTSAHKLGVCDERCCRSITDTLRSLGFSLDCPYPKEQMVHAMLTDKKRKGDSIDLILPYAVGDCRIYPLPVRDLLFVFPD